MSELSGPSVSENKTTRLPLQEFKNEETSAQQNDPYKSRIMTASKAQRVAVDNNGEGAEPQGSPLYKVLRSGKRILQTPAAKKAARVAVEPPATTSKKASRVLLSQEPYEDAETLNQFEDVASFEASTCDQTAPTASGTTDTGAESSWLVSTETVPIMTSQAGEDGDSITAEKSPDESPLLTGFDACLVEMHKAGLVTKGSSTYGCDTDAVAAENGLVNMYTPLPAKTPQNTPDVKVQPLPPKLQLSHMSQEVDDVPSPPSSSRVHPSSHALDGSFSVDSSPAPSAPPPKSQQSSTPALWKHSEPSPEGRMLSTLPTIEAVEGASVPCQQSDTMQLHSRFESRTALASAETALRSTPMPGVIGQISAASPVDCTPSHEMAETAQAAASFVTPEPQAASGEAQDAPLVTEQTPGEEDTSRDTSAIAFIPRDKATPHMERKLRDIKANEWSTNDEVKIHKSNLERMKEAAAAARKKSISSAEKSLTRKLVQNAVGKAVRTDGKDLGEGMVKHKSRLEREKEAAKELAHAASATQGGKPKKEIPSSSAERQGLSAMKVHKSRLERERDDAAKRRAESSAAGQEQPLPSYMRATKASIAMKKESSFGEDMKVHKSQLERDREAALAIQDARKKAGVNPLTPFPHKARRSQAASAAARAAFGGQGLGNMPVHKSALEKEKEAAAKDGSAALKRAPRPPVARGASVAAGGGLGDMKVHKSRLQKDKEGWDKAAAEHAKAGKVKSKSGKPRQAATTFMRPTEASSYKAGVATPSKQEEAFSSFVPN